MTLKTIDVLIKQITPKDQKRITSPTKPKIIKLMRPGFYIYYFWKFMVQKIKKTIEVIDMFQFWLFFLQVCLGSSFEKKCPNKNKLI